MSTLSEIVGIDLDVDDVIDGNDPDRCAHVVKRMGRHSAHQVILLAEKHGLEVEALCGYRWVPKSVVPDHMTPCRACVKEWERLAGGGA